MAQVGVGLDRAAHPSQLADARSRYPNNLPLQLTSFIGREPEISAIRQHVWAARLLTLTGPGGCGKSRLALRVAADLLDAFADGVWLVEFASLSDPALVTQAVASLFDIHDQTARPQYQVLSEVLQPREVLLVFDNCEHLSGAAELF